MRARAALPQPERFTLIQAVGALVSAVLVGAVLLSLIGSGDSASTATGAASAGTPTRQVHTTGAQAGGVAPAAVASGGVAGVTTTPSSAPTGSVSPRVGASAGRAAVTSASMASSSTQAAVSSSHGGPSTSTSRGVSAVVTAHDATGIVEAARASLAGSSAAFTPLTNVGGGALESTADTRTPTAHATAASGQPDVTVTSADTTTTTTADNSGSSASLPSLPAGPDGAWIVPPIPGGLDPAGNPLPDVPGIATGPAPAGNVLAMGNAGDQFAFDVSTRTWILAPDSGVGYKPGVGYISMGSSSSTASSGSSTSGATDPTSALPSGLSIDSSVPAGRDGSWIVPPVKGDLDPAGNPLPDLPGIAVGPAPAGDVLAMGSPGDEFAFDVTNRTWILTPTSGIRYLPGVGYVSAP